MSGPHDDGTSHTEASSQPEASSPGELATAGEAESPGERLAAPQTPDDARLRTFSLEGRAAPGLYLVGWLLSVAGLGVVVVAMLSGGGAGPLLIAGLIGLALGLLAASGAQALERSGQAGLTYHGPSPVLAFAAVVPLTLLVVIAVLVPLRALGLDPLSPVATAVGLAATALVYAGVVRLLVVGTGALTWRDMGLGLPAARVAADLAYGAAFALPVLFATGLLVLLLSRFLAVPPSPLPEAVDVTGIVANLISAAIIAPIGEELFFRGFATTAWARTRGMGPAIVLGAVFFAFAHVVTLFDDDFGLGLQRALFAFAVRIPVGLVLGWLFLTRRSLPASIGLHATYNAIPVLVLAFAPR